MEPPIKDTIQKGSTKAKEDKDVLEHLKECNVAISWGEPAEPDGIRCYIAIVVHDSLPKAKVL